MFGQEVLESLSGSSGNVFDGIKATSEPDEDGADASDWGHPPWSPPRGSVGDQFYNTDTPQPAPSGPRAWGRESRLGDLRAGGSEEEGVASCPCESAASPPTTCTTAETGSGHRSRSPLGLGARKRVGVTDASQPERSSRRFWGVRSRRSKKWTGVEDAKKSVDDAYVPDSVAPPSTAAGVGPARRCAFE